MIELKDVRLDFEGKRILDGFSLSLGAEQAVCFSGPSGCGKTTLMRVIAGLQRPLAGHVSGVPEKVAFMFQEDRLMPWLTALENIAAVLPSGSGEAGKWLEAVELPGEANTYPRELSGGMQRRVALARALAFKGELLILDEPFKGMDNALVSRMADLVVGQRVPVLMTSHQGWETEAMKCRVIEFEGPPLRIK